VRVERGREKIKRGIPWAAWPTHNATTPACGRRVGATHFRPIRIFMDWPSKRGRVRRRGAASTRVSAAIQRFVGRHATVRPHTPSRASTPPLTLSLSLSLARSLPDESIGGALARTFRRVRARPAFQPAGRTEKRGGDLLDGAGRGHPFSGLPKRLNSVADLAIRRREPRDYPDASGLRESSSITGDNRRRLRISVYTPH